MKITMINKMKVRKEHQWMKQQQKNGRKTKKNKSLINFFPSMEKVFPFILTHFQILLGRGAKLSVCPMGLVNCWTIEIDANGVVSSCRSFCCKMDEKINVYKYL